MADVGLTERQNENGGQNRQHDMAIYPSDMFRMCKVCWGVLTGIFGLRLIPTHCHVSLRMSMLLSMRQSCGYEEETQVQHGKRAICSTVSCHEVFKIVERFQRLVWRLLEPVLVLARELHPKLHSHGCSYVIVS